MKTPASGPASGRAPTPSPGTSHTSRVSRPSWRVALAWLAGLLLLLALVLAFFPWDLLRGPVSRAISKRMDRPFEITRHLDVRLGRHLTVLAEGVVVGNPSWARSPHLLEADAAELELRWWPLFSGRIDMPRLSLRQPVLVLERHADGRRSWAFGSGKEGGKVPVIGELVVDQGRLGYFAPAEGVDVQADFGLRPEGSGKLPLSFNARGRYQGFPFSAQGRSGGVLQLHENLRGPFPIELQASAGQTRLKAAGTVTQLAALVLCIWRR